MDAVTNDGALQVFQWYECTHFHVLNVRQLGKHLAARDIFAFAMQAADDHAGERRPGIGAANLVVDLTNAHARNVRIADCEIAIGLGLFELELRNETRALQLALAT